MMLQSFFRIYFLLLYCFLILPSQSTTAQDAGRVQPLEPGHLILQAEALRSGGTIILGSEPWLYRAGDDPSWADPELDDTGWMLLPPDFDPDSLAEDVWTGTGWFRTHLHVEPELRNTSLALSFFQLGASEVYLDGKNIGGFGVIGTSAEDDQPYSPKGLPLTLHLDDRAEHVLAVRYAYRDWDSYAAHFLGAHARHARGFFLLVKPVNTGFYSFYYTTLEVPFTLGVILGILFLLGGLHILLYWFDRRESANLYFSLLTLSAAVAIYLGAAFDSSGLLRPDIGRGLWINAVAFRMMLVLIVAVYYQIFYRRLLHGFWVFVVIGISGYLFDYWTATFQGLALLSLLVSLEGVRVTGLAIWKKKDGGWILGTGMLVFFLLQLTNRIMGVQNPVDRAHLLVIPDILRLWNEKSLFVIFIYLTIPIAMSVLLAFRFSKTSRNLQVQLGEVQRLSEQTLAQEREKQVLIEKQKHQLEVEVAERTSDLRQSLIKLKTTQAQLIQQEKMASLGHLTAGIAHEIKNPLNFVNNFAEVNEELVDELLEILPSGGGHEEICSDLKQNTHLIAKHGKRADGIIHAMMQHASGGSGERIPTDINQLVSEHIDLAYHGHRAQSHTFTGAIERSLDEKIGRVEIVPQEIGRVLLNLLDNAFDAVTVQAETVDGPYTPTVNVSTRQFENRIEIRVSDNGPGIPADILNKIFEPFFTTKPAGSGTGLGLSLAYDTVTQGHGGTMTVESKEGEGATFVITLL